MRERERERIERLTDHTAAEEKGLNQANLILVPTNQPPLRHRRAPQPPDPLPRTGLQPTDAPARTGRTPPANAPPPWFAVREYHYHRVEGLQGPRQARQDEVLQLPPPELAAVLLQHVVDAELLRRGAGVFRRREER